MDHTIDIKEEIRCDYRVGVKQKKIWAIELDLMERVLAVCSKHGLRCWAFGGTLLGAVRHGGFIPWDDDIDLIMPRDDYERFCKVAPQEFQYPYFFQSPLTDPQFFRNTIRVRNCESTGYERKYGERDVNQGIFVDVFPVDGCEQSRLAFTLRRFHIRYIDAKCKSIAFEPEKKNIVRGITVDIFRTLDRIGMLKTDLRKAYRQENCIAARIPWEKAGRVCMIMAFSYSADQYIYPKSCFADTEYLPFEHLSVPVPRGYDEVLRINYGDYMQLPPPESRGQWHDDILFDPDTPFREHAARGYRDLLSQGR